MQLVFLVFRMSVRTAFLFGAVMLPSVLKLNCMDALCYCNGRKGQFRNFREFFFFFNLLWLIMSG